MICNDGYRAILGDKHPWALGSGAFFAEHLLLKIQRRGSANFLDRFFGGIWSVYSCQCVGRTVKRLPLTAFTQPESVSLQTNGRL
jgi:hypothetical protein